MKMSYDYCDNCGRRSHCGNSLSEVLEPGRDHENKLIKICEKCRCDQCTNQINEDENRYSDESLFIKPTAQELENHYFSAPWVVFFRDMGIDWKTGKPIDS